MDAEDIVTRWNKARTELIRVRGDHQLNGAFFEGYQDVEFSTTYERLEHAATAETNRTIGRHNVFRSNMEVLLGKWSQSELEMQVPAPAADDLSVNTARIAEHVLEFARIQQDWESLRQGVLFDVLKGGTALITVDWDGDADSLSIDPQTGLPSDTGEVKLSSFSIDEFLLPPGCRTPEQAQWLLTGQALDPEMIQDWYNLSEAPKKDAAGMVSPGFYRSTTGRGKINNELALLLVHYQPPTNRNKKGKVIHVAGSEIIHQEDWPYPHKKIPGYVFRASFDSGRWWASTFVSEARHLQRRYNAARTKQAEHSDYASAVKLLAPYGLLVNGADSITDIPGEILEYHPDPDAQMPTYLQPPDSPRSLQRELEMLAGEISDIMHIHDISRGKAPGDRNSGTALAILAEQDETPLGMIAQDQARGWARIAEMVLGLYAEKATGDRIATFQPGSQLPALRQKWTGKVLEGVRRVHVPLESTRPISRAARQARIVEMAERFPAFAQTLSPSALAKIFDVPADHAMATVAPDVASALFENQLLLTGEVPLPEPWEDHEAHMSQHNAMRTTPAYRYAPPQIQQIIDDHIDAHQRLIEEEMSQQMALNQMQPGMAAMPQANRPIGSAQSTPADLAGMM